MESQNDMTPTARSLGLLRKQGYIACSVEKWVPSTPAGYKGPIITRDAFNFGDILAAKIGQPGALLVQTTSGSNASTRVKKIRQIAEAGIWLAAGNGIVVHSWAKRGQAGKRKLWDCTVIPIMTMDFEAALKDAIALHSDRGATAVTTLTDLLPA